MATILGYGPIPWDALATFSGSAATLIAGFAAVIAAYKLGKRQVDIAERQTAILEKQTDTDYRRLQSELYDKRLSVYRRLDAFLDHLDETDRVVTSKHIADYEAAFAEAQFILSRVFYDYLDENWEIVIEAINAVNLHVANINNSTEIIVQGMKYVTAKRSELMQFRAGISERFAKEITLDAPPPPRISN